MNVNEKMAVWHDRHAGAFEPGSQWHRFHSETAARLRSMAVSDKTRCKITGEMIATGPQLWCACNPPDYLACCMSPPAPLPATPPAPEGQFRHFVSVCCGGERCFCGKPAEHKVEEVIFDDDPIPVRHPYTSYICHAHFVQVMGPAGDRIDTSGFPEAAEDWFKKAKLVQPAPTLADSLRALGEETAAKRAEAEE